MEVLLGVMFSVWSAPRLYHATDRVQLVQCGARVKNWLVTGLVRELQFSRCELLLLEAGS
jgi:hypothetical protein